MLNAKGDRLEFLLTDYERRKQDETRRQVERAVRLEEARKKGTEYLRRFVLEPARNVAERLQGAGHRVVHQELLDAYPPHVRIHLWPKVGPMDEGEGTRHTIELVWGDPDPDSLCAKRWTSEGLDKLVHQGSARPGVLDLNATVAGRGASYVGEGELARFCKIAHNVLLGVVTQNLAEITVLAEKAGVPRRAFLDFINKSVMGSIYTRYKTNAFVNLDWTTTFTPALLRKDMDLGLAEGRALDVPMPVAAAAREALQAHFGAAALRDDPEGYLEEDFAAVLETVALAAGVTLESEESPYPTGLERDGT